MRKPLTVSVLILVGSCGGSDSSSGGEVSSPCDLADFTVVQAYFAGTVAEGVEGQVRNCSFEIEGGEVISVDVFYYGDASGWEGTRTGYENNRGGVTDIASLGDAAFYPSDRGERGVVVQAGGEIFSVSVFTALDEPSAAAVASVGALAGAIADGLG